MTDIVIASTTDSNEQMQAALDYKPSEPRHTGEIRAQIPPQSAVTAPAAPIETPAAAAALETPAPAVGDVPPVDSAAATPPVKVDDEDREQLGRRAQKRIHRLTAERERERERGEQLARENAELRARVGGQQAPVAQPPAQPVAQPPAGRVDESTIRAAVEAEVGPEPKAEDFETHEDWTKALARREARIEGRVTAKVEVAQAVAEETDRVARHNQEAGARQVREQFEQQKDGARGRYTDFDAVMEKATALPLSDEMHDVLMHAGEFSHDIAYYLASHPEEAKDLAAMRGPAAYVELGAVQARVIADVESKRTLAPPADAEVPPSGVATETRTVTSAPDPIRPVTGRTAAAPRSYDQMSQEDFNARRNKEERDWRNARR